MMKSPTTQTSPPFTPEEAKWWWPLDYDANDDAADDENDDGHDNDPHHADFPSLEARSDHVEIEVGNVRGVWENLVVCFQLELWWE